MKGSQARWLAAAAVCAWIGAAHGMVANAAPLTSIGCGQRIRRDVTLAADLGPCRGNGIVVDGDNVTVDLGGHRLLGTPGPDDTVGVLIEKRNGVTIEGGEVADFGVGVTILGGSANTITGLHIHDNIGLIDASGNYGDGIAIFNSPANLVSWSTVEHNGPFDGIAVFGTPSVGNHIENNVITRNNVARYSTVFGLFLNLDDGVNLGAGLSGGSGTAVSGNTITANGLNGVNACSIRGNPCHTTDNVITGNLVQGNGYGDPTNAGDNLDIGDGIHVVSVIAGGDPFPPIHDLVQSNRVFDNAGDGIVVASSSSQIIDNVSIGNGSAVAKFFFDLDDISLSSDCDTNVWIGNTFKTAFPRCVVDGNRRRGSEPRPTRQVSPMNLSRRSP